eukprot:c14292_g1_i2 orf=340-936(-)
MLWLYQSPLSYSTSMIRLPRWRMETSSLQSSWSGNGNGNGKRCRVYIATTGLRVPQGPPQWALSALSLTGWDSHQHCMTILQPATHGRCILFHYRPLNPEDPCIALVALLGGSVPGVVVEREISNLPAKRCWLVGEALMGRGIQDARYFNSCWNPQLQLWRHDCRNHTEGLVEFLTGKRKILQYFKNLPSSETSRKQD